MYKFNIVVLTAAIALTACEFELPGSVSKTGKTEQFVLADKVYTAEEFGELLVAGKEPSGPPRRSDFDTETLFYQVKVQGNSVRCDARTTQSCKTAVTDYETKMQRESGMGY